MSYKLYECECYRIGCNGMELMHYEAGDDRGQPIRALFTQHELTRINKLIKDEGREWREVLGTNALVAKRPCVECIEEPTENCDP